MSDVAWTLSSLGLQNVPKPPVHEVPQGEVTVVVGCYATAPGYTEDYTQRRTR